MNRPSRKQTLEAAKRAWSSSNVRGLREWYNDTSWASRLFTFSLLAALMTVTAWQFNAANPLIALAIATGIGLLVHALLSWSFWIKIVVVWLLNIVTIPVISSFYANVTPLSNSSWMFIESVVISLLASALLTLLSARYAKGKLWFTLALIFFVLNFGGILVTSLLSIHSGGAWVGVGLAATVYVLRCIFPRSRGELPAAYTTEQMGDIVSDLENFGFASTVSKNGISVLAADRKAHVNIIHPVNAPKQITFSGKKGPVYDGAPISSWLASKVVASGQVAKKTPVLTVVAVNGDHSLDRKKYMPVVIRSSSGNEVGVVALVSAKKIDEGLSLALDDIRPQPASLKQIEQLKAQLA